MGDTRRHAPLLWTPVLHMRNNRDGDNVKFANLILNSHLDCVLYFDQRFTSCFWQYEVDEQRARETHYRVKHKIIVNVQHFADQ